MKFMFLKPLGYGITKGYFCGFENKNHDFCGFGNKPNY